MIKKILKIENLFLITCFFWGVLFLLVNPPFQSPDEPEHMFKMWGYTEKSYNFKIKDGWAGQILPRNFGILFNLYDKYRMSNEPVPFELTLKSSLLPLDKDNINFLRFTPTSYTPVSYFPMFIVLWLMKFFNFAPLLMMYILRFCSLLTYLSLSYFAIRITPVKKLLFFVIGLLPVCISQAAAVSTDGITFGVIFLFLAYTLKLAYNDSVEKISQMHLIKWSLLVVLTGILKFSYLPLILVYFLIPQSKFDNSKTYIKIFISALLAGLFAFIFVLFPLINTKSFTGYVYQNHLVSSYEVLKNIFIHPFKYLELVLRTLIHLSGFLFQNMISSIGVTLAMIPASTTYFCWLLLFVGLIYEQITEKKFEIVLKQKFFILVGIIFSVLIIITAVHLVYQTNGYILGIQGRYLTPLIPFTLLLFTNTVFSLRGKFIKYLLVLSIQYVLFINLVTLINRYY